MYSIGTVTVTESQDVPTFLPRKIGRFVITVENQLQKKKSRRRKFPMLRNVVWFDLRDGYVPRERRIGS